MTKRMLVDATHGEETRVAVVSGNRLEELDFEIASRRQLKGNIYLAKVIRVEPSLQAAFVEYGGNRHGFLAFSEIHPDYYRIPVEDRAALLAEEERLAAAEARRMDAMAEAEERRAQRRRGPRGHAASPEDAGYAGGDEALAGGGSGSGEEFVSEAAAEAVAIDAVSEAAPAPVMADDEFGLVEMIEAPVYAGDADAEVGEAFDEVAETAEPAGGAVEMAAEDAEAGVATTSQALEGEVFPPAADDDGRGEDDDFDVVGGDEDEGQPRRARSLRSYKIQEVIKRRQILLVQVTKEERGNKGAALTTYLSLPGRYCVLMPNTGRGGGISRKITNPADRRRLKDILSDLDIPQGMAVILRTAGLERAKPEIRRDLEYLLRLWDDIREQTMKSVAPTLIYEEANLIKRAIRDVYADDIEEVLVDGEAGFRTAQNFMRMMMPSHTGRVQLYKDQTAPLFHRYQVEQQIDAIHSPVVQLRSGGYIVINPTEALVAIDVNSGRSTRERNIEETAFKTNLEAADEVARQLRLRDLAGLVVIDFIDMEDGRNNAAVERRLKEAMKNDRARIQVGRISPFGLMELSRQRLRPSLQETNFEPCPHCAGAGVVRSVESAALHVLRAIGDEGIRRRAAEILVYAPTRVVLYILNHKRADLSRLEARYNFRVAIANDDSLIGAETMRIERMRARTAEDDAAALVSAERVLEETDRELAAAEDEAEEQGGGEENAEAQAGGESGDDRRARRRRRRRRGGRDERDFAARDNESDDEARAAAEPGAEDADGDVGEAEGDGDAGEEAAAALAGDSSRDADRRGRRRRGRRGGRRDRNEDGRGEENGASLAVDPADASLIRAVLPPLEDVAPLEPIDFDLILDADLHAPAVAVSALPVAEAPAADVVPATDAVSVEVAAAEAAPDEAEAEEAPVKATGRRKKAEPAPAEAASEDAPAKPARKRKVKAKAGEADAADAPPASAEEAGADEAAAKPARKRKVKAKAGEDEATDAAPAFAEEAAAKPARKRKVKAKGAEDEAIDAAPAMAEAAAAQAPLPAEEAPSAEEEGSSAEPAPVEAPAESAEPDNAAARAAEVVNQAPEQPKRGWWRR